MAISTVKKPQANHIYDYVIVGSGLSGLILAAELSKHTSNFALIEAGETFGGFNRAIQLPANFGGMTVNNGLRFFPGSDLSRKALLFLENLLSTPIFSHESENSPVTYEAGGFKPFLGFGEYSPSFYEELSYFLSPFESHLKLQPYNWTSQLFELMTGDFYPRSHVTKFLGTGSQIEWAMINGQRRVQGKNFIFCGPTRALSTLLPDEVLPAKGKSKLNKSKLWTAVCLDLIHEAPLTHQTALHVLNGTTQDEVGPCVGRVDGNFSQWLSFVDADEARDEEVIATCLKKIKRQLKRAFQDKAEKIQFERILVVPDHSGSAELKLNDKLRVPKLDNFYVCNGATSSQKNLQGAIIQAHHLLSVLGFTEESSHDERVDLGGAADPELLDEPSSF